MILSRIANRLEQVKTGAVGGLPRASAAFRTLTHSAVKLDLRMFYEILKVDLYHADAFIIRSVP